MHGVIAYGGVGVSQYLLSIAQLRSYDGLIVRRIDEDR